MAVANLAEVAWAIMRHEAGLARVWRARMVRAFMVGRLARGCLSVGFCFLGWLLIVAWIFLCGLVVKQAAAVLAKKPSNFGRASHRDLEFGFKLKGDFETWIIRKPNPCW